MWDAPANTASPRNGHSPAALAGSTAEQCLSIDRAWWRLHRGQPGHHYSDLYHALLIDAADLATAIDNSQQPLHAN
ncbi:hypothetical protein GCM10020369_72770 [Cryptosporangium minutisporangium]|uniref:Uncharacterized protein n=1 Tax=Cryptosporangium minutisporangium TaxID=113569 RepID=A0ABP6TBB9_9ACTN